MSRKPKFAVVFWPLVAIIIIGAFVGIEPLASYKDTALNYVKTQGSKIAEFLERNAPTVTLPESKGTTSSVEKVKSAVAKIKVEDGMGSGMIIDRSGYVLTCYHVVEDAQSAIVVLMDGTQFQGTIVGKNKTGDLAVIKITASGIDFPVVTLGSSNNLESGEEVIAIGYSLGLEGEATLSKGIISAFRYDGGVRYIQTDAAINLGNSGGPLIDLSGNVIGIVNFKLVSEAVEGMGFAIPIDSAKPFITEQMAQKQALHREEEEQRLEQPLLELEKETLRLINVERQSRGIIPVVWNEGLHEGARKHSENMQEKGYLYHDTGGQFAECCYGGPLHYSAESLTAAGTVQAWMSSTAGHREIVLDTQYTQGAIGIARDKGFFATYRCY